MKHDESLSTSTPLKLNRRSRSAWGQTEHGGDPISHSWQKTIDLKGWCDVTAVREEEVEHQQAAICISYQENTFRSIFGGQQIIFADEIKSASWPRIICDHADMCFTSEYDHIDGKLVQTKRGLNNVYGGGGMNFYF